MAEEYNEEEKKLSEFNAGIAKTFRTNKDWEILNDARHNVFAYNPVYGKYNYEIIYDCLVNEYKEAIGKLNDKEKKEAKSLKIALSVFLSKHPIVVMDSTGRGVPSKYDWEVYSHMLDKFEDIIRVQHDEHDLDSPNKRKTKGLFS